jgi:hypothetical protein
MAYHRGACAKRELQCLDLEIDAVHPMYEMHAEKLRGFGAYFRPEGDFRALFLQAFIVNLLRLLP